MSLQQIERDTYEGLWASVDAYGAHSPGEQYLPAFLQMANPEPRHTILDAGRGSGKGAVALSKAGFRVQMCDFTDEGLTDEARALPFFEVCLWKDMHRGASGRWDWAYCCDVMEHIPTAFTMLTVSRLLEVTRLGAFFSISLVPDSYGAFAGKPLHQTVQSFVWWRDALGELGTVKECRDLGACGLYLVTPR